jgi:hypothetical protein
MEDADFDGQSKTNELIPWEMSTTVSKTRDEKGYETMKS